MLIREILERVLGLLERWGGRAKAIARIHLRRFRLARRINREAIEQTEQVLERERERWAREGMGAADRANRELIDEVLRELREEARQLDEAIEQIEREIRRVSSARLPSWDGELAALGLFEHMTQLAHVPARPKARRRGGSTKA